MVSSILTNNGAMTALQSLKATQKNLLDTQNRISTGLKVGTAKDNAATWAVATSMRSDIANFKQVSENLSVSSGVVKTASTGTEQIASLISKIREQVTSVQDGVKDAKTVQATINEYVGQIQGIIGSSSYKGVNLINNSQSGNTQVLASVNADGDKLNPSYISIASQNLTMESGGQLAALSRLTVERAESSYSYAPATGTVATNDKLSFTFKVNGVERVATYAAKAGDTAADMMTGLKDEINARAGSGNAFADIDVNGKLVVKAGSAADVVTFDGETALKKVTGAGLTLGAKTDLAPAAPKYSYGLGGTAPAEGEVYSFQFKVDGQEKTAEYTVLTGDDAAAVMKGLKDAINYAAGTGNEIANVDPNTGKLMVDASLSASAITFEGDSALKVKSDLDGAVSVMAQSSATKASFDTAAWGGSVTAGDKLNFTFTLNGATVVAEGAGSGGTAAAIKSSATSALVADINSKAGYNIAYLDSAGKMVVDAGVAGSAVSFNASSALKGVDADNSTATVAASTADTWASASDFPLFTAGDSLEFTWTVNGATVTDTASGADAATALTNLATAMNARLATAGITGATIDYGTTAAGSLTVDLSGATGGTATKVDASAMKVVDNDASGLGGISGTAVAVANKSIVYTANDADRLDKLSLVMTSGGTSPVEVTRQAGETNKEMLVRFAAAINSASTDAKDIAFIDKEGSLVIDADRATTTAVAINRTSALTVTSATTAGASTKETPASSTDYSDLLATLKTVETSVLAAGAAFGAAQTRIDLQKDFMDKLVDTLTSGVGALVDADMSEEAARLQALQVQEQLGTQALSIANQAPQSILSLFRG